MGRSSGQSRFMLLAAIFLCAILPTLVLTLRPDGVQYEPPYEIQATRGKLFSAVLPDSIRCCDTVVETDLQTLPDWVDWSPSERRLILLPPNEGSVDYSFSLPGIRNLVKVHVVEDTANDLDFMKKAVVVSSLRRGQPNSLARMLQYQNRLSNVLMMNADTIRVEFGDEKSVADQGRIETAGPGTVDCDVSETAVFSWTLAVAKIGPEFSAAKKLPQLGQLGLDACSWYVLLLAKNAFRPRHINVGSLLAPTPAIPQPDVGVQTRPSGEVASVSKIVPTMSTGSATSSATTTPTLPVPSTNPITAPPGSTKRVRIGPSIVKPVPPIHLDIGQPLVVELEGRVYDPDSVHLAISVAERVGWVEAYQNAIYLLPPKSVTEGRHNFTLLVVDDTDLMASAVFEVWVRPVTREFARFLFTFDLDFDAVTQDVVSQVNLLLSIVKAIDSASNLTTVRLNGLIQGSVVVDCSFTHVDVDCRSDNYILFRRRVENDVSISDMSPQKRPTPYMSPKECEDTYVSYGRTAVNRSKKDRLYSVMLPIVIVLFILLILLVLFCCYCHRRKKDPKAQYIFKRRPTVLMEEYKKPLCKIADDSPDSQHHAHSTLDRSATESNVGDDVPLVEGGPSRQPPPPYAPKST